MFVRRATVLIGVALMTVALAAPAHANHRVHATYIGGLPAGGSFLPVSGPSFTIPEAFQRNVGGAWMEVPPWATALDVDVVDYTSEVVASDVVFVIDEYGPTPRSPRFCGSGRAIPIPLGTKALYVRVLDAGSTRCDPPGVPTYGTIDVTFS